VKAFITGIAGQDGSYLAELLLEKGYEVHGLVRSQKLNPPELILHTGNLCDGARIKKLLCDIRPDEVYNLASVSHMQESFQMSEETAEVIVMGTLRLLEAIRTYCPHARLFQAGSSELFGHPLHFPQTEKTPFHPRSLYAVAKLYAYEAVAYYRKTYHVFGCSGILFNHESPRRRESFISRKISLAAARIGVGLQEELVLGNLDAQRDWGYAKDFVEGMWKMLQQDQGEDFILATGRTTSVRKFVELAFAEVGINIIWKGRGVEEKGIDQVTGKVVVRVSSEFFRPLDDRLLVGDPTKAKEKLGWVAMTTLEELVQIMVKADNAQILQTVRPS
jgi:GDPmannose 4,6-dehydratase